MRSLLTSMLIVFCSLSVFGQYKIDAELAAPRTDDFVLDSFYHWGWDPISLDWALSDRTRYSTDDNQNVTNVTSSALDSMNQWIDQDRTLSSYDDNNHLINEIQQQWYGGVWANVGQTVYTYDGNNDQTVILSQSWDGANWTNVFQQVYTYDNNHTILTLIHQYWTGVDWGYNQRVEYTYDSNNRLALRLFEGWNGLSWYDISRSIYVYDSSDNLDTLLYQKYLFSDWTDDYRTIYDYDAHHNRTLILEQLAVGIDFWEDQGKYEYVYDQFDKIINLVNYNFDNNTWVYNYQYNITNDENHNRSAEVFQTWVNEWLNQDSTQYYYSDLTSSHDVFDHELLSIKPNPASDFIFVDYPKPIDGSILIYSIQGVKLLEIKALHEQSFRINVASLMPGIYFVATHVDNHIQTSAFEKY